MPKKIKQKQKVSQKVIQNVIVKVGEMKRKKKARRRAKRAMKEAEGISTFRQGTNIPPMVTYQTSPTQFTPYIPKEFEEAYRIAKDMYAKKEVEPVGFMDLKPVAEPLKPKAKEVLEDKEIVTPVPLKKESPEIDVSNISKNVSFQDNIKDKPLDYEPVASLNVFPQSNINNISTISEFIQKGTIKERAKSVSSIDKRSVTPSLKELRDKRAGILYGEEPLKKQEEKLEQEKIIERIKEEKLKKPRGRPKKEKKIQELEFIEED